MSLFRTEYRTPQRQTPQAPPFGRVLVGVGPEGVPDGLKVLNISSMARAEGTSELVVEKRLVTQGKLLFLQRLLSNGWPGWPPRFWLGTSICLIIHTEPIFSDPRSSANYTTS